MAAQWLQSNTVEPEASNRSRTAISNNFNQFSHSYSDKWKHLVCRKKAIMQFASMQYDIQGWYFDRWSANRFWNRIKVDMLYSQEKTPFQLWLLFPRWKKMCYVLARGVSLKVWIVLDPWMRPSFALGSLGVYASCTVDLFVVSR